MGNASSDDSLLLENKRVPAEIKRPYISFPENIHPMRQRAIKMTVDALILLCYQSYEIDALFDVSERKFVVSAEQFAARIITGNISSVGALEWNGLKKLLISLRDNFLSCSKRAVGEGSSLSIPHRYPGRFAAGKKALTEAIRYFNNCVADKTPNYIEDSSDVFDF